MAYYIALILFLFCTVSLVAQQHGVEMLPPDDTLRLLQLQEVTVTARENLSPATSSSLSRTAIGHIQPFSLSDMMQLLPGGITPEVNLHSPQYFRIRSSAPGDHANALGTGIWMDGARISNNAGLQMGILPGESAEYGFRGVDTRILPLGNIESVEIIRGIPSARYGDITTGAVLVRSRAAREPLTIHLKATPGIKAAQASRGWYTGNTGTLNLFAGFTQTYADPRTHERLFRKTEIQAAWSGNTGNASINARITGSLALSSSKREKDRQNNEYTKASRKSLSVNLYGTWHAERKFITSLEYRGVFGYAREYDKQQRQHVQMEAISTSRPDSGEDTAFLIPPQYLSLARIEGIPINTAAALTANLLRQKETWRSYTSIGAEWNSEGNQGLGRMDDPARPSGLWTRPRDYRDIPFMHSASLFIEESFILRGKAGTFSATTGLRLSGVKAGKESFPMAAEPRFNLRYSPVAAFTLKTGWGILRKHPTLAYLFPAPVYTDHISYRYNDPATSQHLAVVTTDVVRQTNTPVTLPRNTKTEIGFITRLAGIEIDVTAFYENLKGGFTLQDAIRPSSYRIYENDNQPGNIPVYTPEGVAVNGTLVPYTSDTTFLQYNRTGNELSQKKRGIEYVITTGQWKAIASNIVIDGAWLRTDEHIGGFSCGYQGSKTGNKSYPYAAIFENAQSVIYERLNTNFRFITHIPAIRFISSLTFQAIWLDRSRNRYASRYDNPVYMKDTQGNAVSGNIYSDGTHNKYINPVYYMDTQGNIHPFTSGMAADSRYTPLIATQQPYHYLTNSYRPYFLLNLQITKEIGHYARLTFYANNIAAMNPSRYATTMGNYTTLNPPAFYGVELQWQF